MEQVIYEDMYRLERSHWWFRARREILESVVRERVAAGGAILDVGCGTGFVLESLRRDYDVHGLDAADIAVRFCHAKGLDFVTQGVLGTTKLPRVFDLVMFLDVLEHVDDDVGLLRKSLNVLSPTGSVLITVPALSILWSRHDVVHHHRRRYDRGSLERLLASAGLEPVFTSYYNSVLFPLVLAARTLGRLRGDERSSDADAVPAAFVNEVLYQAFRAERLVVGRLPLPLGVSLICVARPLHNGHVRREPAQSATVRQKAGTPLRRRNRKLL